jgi:two-component system sensor histidine kinase RegB
LRITQAYAHEAYGGAELERVSLVSASELLRRVCRDCRKRADPKRVGIVVRSCHSVASVQPMAFAKAIRELVDHAVTASRAGQSVSVSVFTTSDRDLLWQVRDDGVGIPAKLLSDIGEPHRATKRGELGLGVVVARIIVDEHRGLLHFESTPGLGTTATVWLPRRRAVPVG